MNKGRIITIAVFVLLISGSIFALSATKAGSQFVSGAESMQTAYVEAKQANAGFKMAGRVVELLVEEGETVEQGQVIARLESSELESQVEQARAAVKVQEGKLAEARAAVGLAEGKINESSEAVNAAKAKQSQASSAVTLTAESVEQQIKEAEAALKAAEAKLAAVKSGPRPEEQAQAESRRDVAKEALDAASKNVERAKALLADGLASEVDVEEQQLKYEKAKSDYDVAQKQVEMSQKGSRQEEIDAAQAQVEQAKAAVNLAKANKAQVNIKQGDVEAASAGVAQAEATEQTAKSGVSQAEATVLSAEAGLEQAQANLAEVETYLGYTELVAPTDGVVVSQQAEIGELVSAGYPVYTIESHENRWATFYFPETDVAGVSVGDTVEVGLVSLDTSIKGEVVQLSPTASYATQKASQSIGETDIRTFGVKVMLNELPPDVATGMTVIWHGTGEEQ
ncbi:HlyD family efflux transporter periplasmic adaptor subunit [Alkalihalobacillus oceani]|uniref:HlyD family efflux transporter periplasmic adaptor subunit n=1 Tax=Halalkalibacter oceani TaxID=1653776 RepID=A0A9X2DUE4_9BACI|nr:HlyD family efflux transporter periplasmic adaptor subunit [Halalkalibacter oceani]MCM3715618.1 HlyD family efflux transporter periplasmic adaptor subunit [Halalkalibacter oceani]